MYAPLAFFERRTVCLCLEPFTSPRYHTLQRESPVFLREHCQVCCSSVENAAEPVRLENAEHCAKLAATEGHRLIAELDVQHCPVGVAVCHARNKHARFSPRRVSFSNVGEQPLRGDVSVLVCVLRCFLLLFPHTEESTRRNSWCTLSSNNFHDTFGSEP